MLCRSGTIAVAVAVAVEVAAVAEVAAGLTDKSDSATTGSITAVEKVAGSGTRGRGPIAVLINNISSPRPHHHHLATGAMTTAVSR